MVETILSGVSGAVPIAKIAPPPRKEFLEPDGSAIPDIIAYHHRPEDLDDMSEQSVPDESDTALFGKDGMTFGDLLDIINPLQHIPIVSTIYRAMTGDEISPGARMVGGALFGGPFGLGFAIVNAAVEASTGEDIGDTILTALTGGDPAIPASAAAAKPVETAVPAIRPDPAKFSAVTMPARVPLNAKGAGQRPNNPTASMPDRPPGAAGAAFFRPAGLPYGGIGTLPFATPFQDNDDPVAAVLRARSAVPRSGPVPGLGRAPLGQIDRQPLRPDRGRQSPLPNIDQRLADKLSALSAKTAAQAATAKPAGNAAAIKPLERNGAPAAPRQFTPTDTISQTMLNALDRYQRMKKMETGNPSG